jgi:hypothetical protein
VTLANAVPRNIPKMHPKFISMGEKYPSNKPTAIPITNLSNQCILLSSFDIQLVQFTNLNKLYYNVGASLYSFPYTAISRNFFTNPSKKNATMGEKSTPTLCNGRISLIGFRITSVT